MENLLKRTKVCFLKETFRRNIVRILIFLLLRLIDGIVQRLEDMRQEKMKMGIANRNQNSHDILKKKAPADKADSAFA